MSEHLSEPELRGFVQHTLEADRVVAVDDHLALCESCRERAAAIGRLGVRVTQLSADLLALEQHLSEEEIQRYVAGGLPPGDRALLDRHLAECEECAGETEDLRAWARARSGNRNLKYLAVAAVLALVVLVPLAIRRGAPSVLPGLERLPPHQQSKVEAALREGVAELPSSVAGMSGRSETLMGERPTETPFALAEPLSTATLSDRPVFRWGALPGADFYTLVVLDENLQPVAGPVTLDGTTWTPPQPLVRDRVYVWQVTARRSDESVTAPAPPAPPARFRVMDEVTAELLERVSLAEPDSHLLLGVLFTQAGARHEAEAHLRQVPATDPYASVASGTLERLRDPRR